MNAQASSPSVESAADYTDELLPGSYQTSSRTAKKPHSLRLYVCYRPQIARKFNYRHMSRDISHTRKVRYNELTRQLSSDTLPAQRQMEVPIQYLRAYYYPGRGRQIWAITRLPRPHLGFVTCLKSV